MPRRPFNFMWKCPDQFAMGHARVMWGMPRQICNGARPDDFLISCGACPNQFAMGHTPIIRFPFLISSNRTEDTMLSSRSIRLLVPYGAVEVTETWQRQVADLLRAQGDTSPFDTNKRRVEHALQILKGGNWEQNHQWQK